MDVPMGMQEEAHQYIHEDHQLAGRPVDGSQSRSVVEVLRAAGTSRDSGGALLVDLAA
jgi:hypothetical protein